ncbi:MAG TPA: ABC transporter ATP-binding protein [Chloroflexota bacterium]|nr:ABC transporter ATP-binding protein [Chloroflexota bacterium]
MSEALIELHQIVKVYESAAGTFTALKGVSLSVRPGEFVGIVGKSGCGKSTLINAITGIDRPTSGEVIVDGTSLNRLDEGKLAEWRGRHIGVIFQFFQLLPMLSAVENVMLPMDFCNQYRPKERPERAMTLLEQFGVADAAQKSSAALSGGQQQRVAIARALANDPPLIVADEPTGNLDSQTAAAVFDLFVGLVERGKTIVMVTHDRALARRLSRTVTLADGAIVDDVTHLRRFTAGHVVGAPPDVTVRS